MSAVEPAPPARVPGAGEPPAGPVAGDFARRVLAWQARHGRRGLPWQDCRDPYRVWLSEVMLQQTQVATVLDYYPRFLARFPDLQALAAAPQQDVLAQWSGLGYYSRARNLHRCAGELVARHGAEFPRSAQALARLPGIGRSTAAAIAAFCFGERVAILDGNVRRVLARVLAFAGDLARPVHERALWLHATDLLPRRRLAQTMPRYTQGLMDIGATLCLPRQPLCAACPLAPLCRAHALGETARYPVETRSTARRSESWWLLLARRGDGAVWLERRPQQGIWAGLHAAPVFDSLAALQAALAPALRRRLQVQPPFVHVLTHRDLQLHPLRLEVSARWRGTPGGQWFGADAWPALGLPAPLRRLLEEG